MKVLIIEGGKKNGRTDQLAKQFAKGAESAGHDVDIEYLISKQMHGCIDCQTCTKNGGVCIWKDDLVPVFEKALVADVWVFACPVYYYGLTSQLKTFIDRTYAWHSRVKNKKLYFITSSQAPYDEQFKHKLQYVINAIQGYADCFWGDMTFVKTIGGWDVDHYPDMTKHPAYQEAEEAGEQL